MHDTSYGLQKSLLFSWHYVYQAVWDVTIGKVLVCRREPTNAMDRYVCCGHGEELNCNRSLTKKDVKMKLLIVSLCIV